MADIRIVGNIAGFHGIKGEIKVYPLLNDRELFKGFKKIYISESENETSFSDAFDVNALRFHKSFALVKLKGYPDLNSVEHMKGYVYAELDENLSEDEFYITDLEEAKVIGADDKEYGTVKNVSDHGQTILFIKLKDEFNARRDLMLPFVEEYIKQVDMQNKTIFVEIPDELLELAL